MKLLPTYHNKHLAIYPAETSTKVKLPFIENGISAGFPSPADDFIELTIDLNKELIKHPSTTFIGKVKGDSMQDVGFNDGDLLMIDKSLPANDGSIVVCSVDREFTVKRIKKDKNCIWLIAENKKYQPIQVTEDNDFNVFGVVTYIIKRV
jgi:DNA polymerase V